MLIKRSYFSGWNLVFLIAFLLEISVVSLVGLKTYSQYKDVNSASDDVGWAVYQMALEHQRLLGSTHDGSSNDEILLRLQIFGSRVKILMEDRHLKDLRNGPLHDRLNAFFTHLEPVMSVAVSATGLTLKDIALIRFETEQHDGLVRSVAQELVQQYRIDRFDSRQKLSNYLMLLLVSMAAIITTFTLSIVAMWFESRRLDRSMNRLMERSAHLRGCLTQSPDAIMNIDSSGQVTPLNDQAVSLQSEPAYSQISAGLSAALDSDQEALSIGGVLRLTASERLFDVYVLGIGSINGDLGSNTIVSIRDVTLLARQYEKDESYQKALTDASRLNVLGLMVASVGHEIGQPLAAASNFIYVAEELLREGKPSNDIAFHISKSKTMLDRITQITAQIRSLLPLRPEALVRVDLNDIVYAAIDIVQAATPDVSVTFMKSNDVAMVEADPLKITQIVLNLIKNAVEQSKSRKVLQAVNVTVHSDVHHHSILVMDKAGGVCPDQAALIFQPLYGRKLTGAGLGLAISRHLAEEHGGSLTFLNNVEGGTTFTLLLPAVHHQLESAIQ